MSNDNDLMMLLFALRDAKVKANLGISRDETLAQFSNEISPKKRDEFWGKVLKHQKLPNNGFKLFVLDVANLEAELNGKDQVLEHEPQYFMFLGLGPQNQLCYVHQVEGKLDTAEQYLANIRKVQQFMAINAKIRSPKDQDKLRLTIILKRFHGDQAGLELLALLKDAGFDLMVEFQNGSSPFAAQVLKSAFDHGITTGQGKAISPNTAESKYLTIPEAECPVLSCKKQQVPLHTFVVLDPSLLTRKTRELKQQAQLVLTAYQREHMATMEPVLTDEFGFEHQVFTTHESANGTTQYQIDEAKLTAVAFSNLSLILATTKNNCSALELSLNLATSIAQATMFLTEEELNTDNQGYHKLSRKQLYHVINRQSIINLLTGTNSLY